MCQQSVDALDITLFDPIDSQTRDDDRRALLAVQSAVARHFGEYAYLEIGSHLGGSIQTHLVDPRCTQIYSIDPRPLSQPDDRGLRCEYPDNSTERMLELLKKVDADAVGKIKTLEHDASDVDPDVIETPPHLCFIDGEHTVAAVLSDFEFCHRVCHPQATICFHDSQFVWPAVRRIERSLRRQGIAGKLILLPGSVVALALPGSPVARDDTVQSIRRPSAYALKFAVHHLYTRHIVARRHRAA